MVTVSVRRPKVKNSLNSTYTRPQSFFDPNGSMKRGIAAHNNNKDSFVSDGNVEQNNEVDQQDIEE